MRDDLIGLILGCGCRQKCCCPEKETPAVRVNTLFRQQSRTTTPPRLPDESPLIVPVQSYDSPQRPGDWGKGHLPSLTPNRAFTGTGGGPIESLVVLDDGSIRLVKENAVTHAQRRLTWKDITTQVQNNPADVGIECSRLNNDQVNENGDLVNDPRYAPVGWTTGPGAQTETTYQERSLTYGGQTADEGEVETFTTSGVVRTGRLMTGGVVLSPYRLLEFWEERAVNPNPNLTVWRRFRRVQGYGVYEFEETTWDTIVSTLEDRTLGAWAALGQTPYPEVRTVATRSQLYWVLSYGAPPPPTPPETRWSSPDGRVAVVGDYTKDHGDLSNATLTAYGHSFTGGSWAALCGPLIPGSPPTVEPWVLHEQGTTITRITPDGQTEAMTRNDFETEVLRLTAGSFLRFSSVGTLFNTWPPQWAFAECGVTVQEEVRAIGLHDPWRDSIRGRKPENGALPESWFWPNRPRRRTPAGPLAPLGLTLADVLEGGGATDPGGGS